MEGEEDDEEDEGRGDEDETEDGNGADSNLQGFAARWKWLILVDEVSEITKLNWVDTFQLDIGEFLVYASYSRDKANEINRRREEWARRH